MSSITTTAIFFFAVLTLVSSDAECNCYCPNQTIYVGYYPLATTSTLCDDQTCLDGCPVAFPTQCSVGTTYGSCRYSTTNAPCRDNANGLRLSLTSLIFGLIAVFPKKYL